MELKYLNTLKAILETGSFQKAARKLNYTQSTVTFQIQQLEQELSMKLFEKIGRRMLLTQAGQEILPYIDTILQSAEQICNYGKNISEMTGTLRIAIPESLLSYKMQPALKVFREQAPNVKLILKALNCYTIQDEIINGGADIGIHYDVGGYPSSVITESLGDFEVTLVASPVIASEHLDFLKHHQRKPLNLISSDTCSIYQKMFDKYLQEKNIILDTIMELWSIEATKKSVISNLGIAYLPKFAVEEELKKGAVIALNTDLDCQKITAICAYHKNKWINPPMKLFIRLLKQEFTE